MNDFLALAGNWETPRRRATSPDFNGVVNLSDWLAFKVAYNAFNPPAGAQAVPEPTGLNTLYPSACWHLSSVAGEAGLLHEQLLKTPASCDLGDEVTFHRPMPRPPG